MAWTTPITWESGQKVTADNMNEQVRDNLNFLKDRFDNNDEYTLNEGSDYTTTSTSFVDIDATNLALTLTTDSSEVLLGFCATIGSSTAAGIYFEIDIDGVAHAGNDGVLRKRIGGSSQEDSFGMVILITGLTSASHTFKLQWKTTAGTATLLAGAGTSALDFHPQFWVQEI